MAFVSLHMPVFRASRPRMLVGLRQQLSHRVAVVYSSEPALNTRSKLHSQNSDPQVIPLNLNDVAVTMPAVCESTVHRAVRLDAWRASGAMCTQLVSTSQKVRGRRIDE